MLSSWRNRARSRSVQSEDAVKHIYTLGRIGEKDSLTSVAGHLGVTLDAAAALVAELQRTGVLNVGDEGVALTPRGEKLARGLVRAHRLVERCLADEVGLPIEPVHDEAERAEHRMTPERVD